MSLIGKLFRILLSDRQAGNKSVADLITELSQSKETIVKQVSAVKDKPAHREQMAHVIGIERWAQSRLRVALGDPLTMDEYDGYRPNTTKPLSALVKDFSQTRDKTLSIAEKLKAIPNVETQTVPHNAMGDMRIRSWLQYIETHGPFELRKVKPER